jgi:ribulose-5-phosphate 4-epimerase/fuculose-1-phosphate aldolase
VATPVTFDLEIGRRLLKYARLLAARGYVHNTLGNIVLRAPHADFPHGLAYTKHAELESMYRFAESIIYPKRAERVMRED